MEAFQSLIFTIIPMFIFLVLVGVGFSRSVMAETFTFKLPITVKEVRRFKKFSYQAKQLGLGITKRTHDTHSHAYKFVDKFRINDVKFENYVIYGLFNDYNIQLFGYYATTHNKSQASSYFHVAALDLKNRLPELLLYPNDGFLNKIHEVPKHSIKLDSLEFSKQFIVSCENRRFAYSFCSSKMMEYLMQNPNTYLEIDNGILVLIFEGKLIPQEIKTTLEALTDIRKLMPVFLFKEAITHG